MEVKVVVLIEVEVGNDCGNNVSGGGNNSDSGNGSSGSDNNSDSGSGGGDSDANDESKGC